MPETIYMMDAEGYKETGLPHSVLVEDEGYWGGFVR